MFSRFGRLLFRLLEEPEVRGLPLDAPSLTLRRREMARSKRGLRLSYRAWYARLVEIERLAPPGLRIELGSGSGFLKDEIPALLETDVMLLPHLDVVCRAESLPFGDGSAGAIFMVNVLHHVTRPLDLLAEVRRVLRPGGYLALVEPFVTPLSRLLYGRFHPEPFDPEAPVWELPPSGPLSGGNDALPWIVFVRDRERFRRRFPELAIVGVTPHTCLTHLLSGGVHLRSLLPGVLFPWVHALESRLGPRWMASVALFATIVVRREPSP